MIRPFGLLVVVAVFAAALVNTAGERGAVAGGTWAIDAAPNTATNIVDTDHTITATVTLNGVAQQGASVTFNILTGPNATGGKSGSTDVNGQISFT